MPIIHIISGGQTGADRGGLDAAMECGIPCGGWCPKERKAEDGKVPEKYLVRETRSSNYNVRTKANVCDSDATVIFTPGELTGGSLKTLRSCHAHQKPCLHIMLKKKDHDQIVRDILDWLNGDPLLNRYPDYKASPPENCVLNVAGSRESRAPGIRETVRKIMVKVISRLQEKSS